MTKKLDCLHEISYVIMEVLFYYLLFLTFQNVYYPDHMVPYLEGIKLLPMVVLVYLFRKYIKHLLAFIGLHVMVLALLFLMNLDGFCTVLYVVFWVVQLLQSLYFWKKEGAKPYKEMPLGFMVVFLIMGIYGQNVTKEYYYLVCGMGILYYLLHLAAEYSNNYSKFLKNQNEIKHFPYQKINLIHNMYLSILTGVLVLLIIIVILAKPENLTDAIGAFFFGLLQKLFSSLAEVPVKEEAEVSTTEQSQQQNFFGEGFEDQMPKNEMLLKILEIVFNVLCVVAIVACVLLLIYAIFEFFKKYMNKNLMDSDEVEEIKKEKRVKIMKREREKGSLFSRFTLSNSEKIRKLYYKRMKLYEKKQVIALKDYLTPEELKELVESQTKDKMKEMTSCYEEARYGKDEQTKEKVMKMKASIPK
ncbi:MAG: hypothetical protein IJA32_14275 [Lachnospiraceae bacterium]|nr:hypothetical protein [Lachnospiraceae bacterium]